MEVYGVITYDLLCPVTLPNARGFADMTSCEHHRCAYIADHIDMCVHRLDLEGHVTQWAVKDKPRSVSVNAAHNVLVTCDAVRKIKEFRSHGGLLREVTLPDVINPLHGIQLTNGQFVVCHGDHGDEVNRVCLVNADGKDILHSHGGQPGSDTGQYNGPCLLYTSPSPRDS